MAKRASTSYSTEEWEGFFWRLRVRQRLTVSVIAKRTQVAPQTASGRFKNIEARLIEAQSNNANAITDEAKTYGVSAEAAEEHFSKVAGYVHHAAPIMKEAA